MADDQFFERALGRIAKVTLALAAGGLIAAAGWGGWSWAAGFALGAAVSWLNFRWLKQVVDALGQSRPTRKRVAILAGLRYALLGGGAYVILRFSSVSMTAALVGLFVSVAAVVIEICFELVYAR
jgi:ATP synthase I chain